MRLMSSLLPLVVVAGGCNSDLSQRCELEPGWCEGNRAFNCLPQDTSGLRAYRIEISECPDACHQSWSEARCVAAVFEGDCRRRQRRCVGGHPAECEREAWVVEQPCAADERCIDPGDAGRPRCVAPACRNGRDDDGDGRIDGADPGCASADDEDEGDEPACQNGLDDDEDWRIDLDDPGCDGPDDDEEGDEPACANRRDDDGDGRSDLADIGCVDLDDDDESDDPPGAACENGFDDDRDGLIDLVDPGCEGPGDATEVDPEGDPPACADGVDDDGDGLIDWPDDPGCEGRGDRREAQACVGEAAVVVEPGAPVRGAIVSGGVDRFQSSCGDRRALDAVFAYRLDAPATLTASVEHPETTLDGGVSIRRACDDPHAERACGLTTARFEDAPAGEYYVIVEAASQERIVGSREAVELPADPQGFLPTDDFGPSGWSDGGGDVFDVYGRITLDVDGLRSRVDVSLGERAVELGDFGSTVRSELFGGLWRVVLDHPEGRRETRRFDFRLTGDLGAGDRTSSSALSTMIAEWPIEALHAVDLSRARPAVTTLVVPGRRSSFAAVRYSREADEVTVEAPGVRLPVTVYVAVTYADPQAVVEALAADPVVDGLGRATGDFVLTITEE